MISTSKFETFGVALIEGLSYGLKLLSTNSGGPKDIVEKSNGILLKKNPSIEELGNAMKILIELNLKQKKIINEYKKKFSEKILCKKLMFIYKNSKKN